MILELDIRGLKTNFMQLFTQYGGVEKYQGEAHHLLQHTHKDEKSTWTAQSSSAQYLQLIKKDDSLDVWHSLLEIETILGDLFEVVSANGMKWTRLTEPRTIEPPRPSFFNLGKTNQGEKTAQVIEKLRQGQAIRHTEVGLLKKTKPIKTGSIILIRGLNQHDTRLLEICYAALVQDALQVTELAANPTKITLSYLTELENQAESTLPAISM